MKAVLQDRFGASDVLYIGETSEPIAKANELLVRVKAFGVNRADILQREGKYPPPKGESAILGLECAGIVEQSNSDLFSIGDEVFALLPGGAYAEKVTIHESMCIKKPQYFSFDEAASIPEAFLTAWQALTWLGNLEEGQSVLIHAGASGVGAAAIQLAKSLNTTVFTTCSSSKIDFCRTQGANFVIDYTSENFSEIINKQTESQGVHLIIDFIGADYLMQNIQSLALDGKIIQLATMSGAVTPIDLRKCMAKRVSLITSTLRSRTKTYQIKLTHDFWQFAESRFASSKLKPVVDSVWDWNDVANAHQHMEKNLNKGKIVLKID